MPGQTEAGKNGVASSESEKKTPDEPSKDKEDEADADGDAEKSEKSKPSTVVSLGLINSMTFSTTSLDADMLDESIDAHSLNMNSLDSTFLSILQSKLQSLLWLAYHEYMMATPLVHQVGIDLSKKGADAILLSQSLVLEPRFSLMLAGTVSLYPHGQAGRDHHVLCTLFGVTFYINAPKDLGALDTVIAGWATKIVSRNDMAFFNLAHSFEKVILYFAKDGQMQLQFAAHMSEKMESLLIKTTAFDSASDQEKAPLKKARDDAKAAEAFEPPESWAFNGKVQWFKSAEYVKSPYVARALEFKLKLLGPVLFFHF